ncbi:MAG: hypothetical protein IT177_22160 [Acidobacteria bacterium]|nr:hypothetical protein [Acidobacteriota bacterium]
MTRARALKQTIRARAAKTGERYTAARRHVLKDIARAAQTGPRVVERAAPDVAAAPKVAREKRGAETTAAPGLAKGAVSDEKVREKTGHGLDHWFAALDRFGGAAKGHGALAKHLNADFGVSGWYSQGITVAYERARGVRTRNQRVSGDFEVSVSKVVSGDTKAVAKAFTNPRRRAEWLAAADPALSRALSAAVAGAGVKRFVIRPDGLGRFRYRSGSATVQLHVIPKGKGKTSVVVTLMKLADTGAVEAHREAWRAALVSLAAHLAARVAH